MSIVNLNPGKNIADDLNVVIEIPANDGRAIKYEMDKQSGLLMVDRFMPTAMHYPCNYGFVPSTLSEDGDPVDVLVMTPFPVEAGCLIRARAIGMLGMTDESGNDNKVLALPIEKICVQYAAIKQLSDVPPIFLDSIVHFFQQYKALEAGKWVKITGWQGAAAARGEIESGIKRYQQQHATV